jgi:hypothetical protein
VLRTPVASITLLTLLATGCAGGRPWPASPVAIATPSFASHGAVTTIDVLPLDLQLWGMNGDEAQLERLRAGAEVNLMNVALDMLARRNYEVGAMIDWNGDFAGGNALGRDDLLATVGSLARYGAAANAQPGQLPVPFLPARLGTATGSDATLYVGGWAYVGEPGASTGEKVVQAVVIGLLVVTVVAIVIAIAGDKAGKSGKSGKSRSGKSGGGGDGGGRLHGGRGGGRVFSASRGAQHLRHRRGAASEVANAFGNVALELALTSPDWSHDPTLPHEGKESQMYLEMTLVDNRTGLVLWHARQTFPASAASAADTARVAHTLLAQLPGRVAPPPGAADPVVAPAAVAAPAIADPPAAATAVP